LTVVLDMDECLLHSKFHGAGAVSTTYRQEEDRPETVGEVNSFWLALDDGVAQVNIRPGLHEFLEQLAQMCDVVVFTAAMPDYAGPVLDRIDPTGKLISRRLYRNSCRQVRGVFLKDLSALGSAFATNPGRCVLLDNNPCSFLCQPTNGILVTSFYDDARDTALACVMQLVRLLESVPDVRPILRDMFRLEALLKE
ncbi:NLI interacting factor, partial [Tribonema minus]